MEIGSDEVMWCAVRNWGIL